MTKKKYVILNSGDTQSSPIKLSNSTRSFLHSLQLETKNPGFAIKVLDTIRQDRAKLVEIEETDILAIRQKHPGLQIIPVMYYETAKAPTHKVRMAPPTYSLGLSSTSTVKLTVIDSKSRTPVQGAEIVAFTDFINRFGAQGKTNSNGELKLNLGPPPINVERLFVYPPLVGYWGYIDENLTLHAHNQIRMEPIQFPFTDSVRYFHPKNRAHDGTGVHVAIIDTGVGPHPHLQVKGDSDNGEGHGSHVAGIIAARGNAPDGTTGIAPGVTLHSYRVFSVPGGMSANFTIAKAIDQAIQDGCDLINMSLKIDQQQNPNGFVIDPVVQAAIEDAWLAGSLCICAAGNDGRTAVDFPARDQKCLAVSALGRIGTFPTDSIAQGDIAPPTGTDPKNFIASFSNKGPEIDMTAAGVGVISTVPGGYGIMSGTSMACPAATGMAARMISKDPNLLNMARNSERTAAMAQTILSSLTSLGFPAELEGGGLI